MYVPSAPRSQATKSSHKAADAPTQSTTHHETTPTPPLRIVICQSIHREAYRQLLALQNDGRPPHSSREAMNGRTKSWTKKKKCKSLSANLTTWTEGQRAGQKREENKNTTTVGRFDGGPIDRPIDRPTNRPTDLCAGFVLQGYHLLPEFGSPLRHAQRVGGVGHDRGAAHGRVLPRRLARKDAGDQPCTHGPRTVSKSCCKRNLSNVHTCNTKKNDQQKMTACPWDAYDMHTEGDI